MKNKYSTVIPFTGFYETWHMQAIDDAELSYFDVEGTGDTDCLPENIYLCNYASAFPEYAKEYVSSFQEYFNAATELDINFSFEALVSPKEYNFTTDRIFCDISGTDLQKIWQYVTTPQAITILKAEIEEQCTSRSGFASFYTNQLEKWILKGWENFDHNEIGILLDAALKVAEVEIDDYEIMESARCNGVIQNIVDDIISKFLEANSDTEKLD